ncbi:MAG: sigma-70 family RNA polymerase sigma factor [Oscillospiraceae bacterium]|nr:sigma-70 family RNA polymerase sigma factor [Oscillospiraceae bacterium]
MNETDLGTRFVSGGEPELEEVIRLFGEPLLRYATTILCDYQEAEDVVQEVFLSAFQNRAAFDGKHLSAWLYKITYHRSLNFRKKHRPISLDEVNEVEVPPAPEAEMSDEVLEILRMLKPEERALLHGRIMEDESYEALSLRFRRSPAALRKQYERSKKKLARYLAVLQRGEGVSL